MIIPSLLTTHLDSHRYVISPYGFHPGKLLTRSFWGGEAFASLNSANGELRIPVSEGTTPFQNPSVPPLALSTELFCLDGSGTLNFGSSRHSMLGNLQIKGNGNNRISLRNDHGHSSGSMTLRECRREYLRYGLSSSFNSLNCQVLGYGSFFYQNQEYHALFRFLNTFRNPVLLGGGKLSEAESSKLKNHLEVNYGVRSMPEALEYLLNQIMKLVSLNVFQSALALDNFTLMGDLIDLDGISIEHTHLPPGWIFCQLPEQEGRNHFSYDNFTSHFIFQLKTSAEILCRIYDSHSDGTSGAIERLQGKVNVDFLHVFEALLGHSTSTLELHHSLRETRGYELPRAVYDFWKKHATRIRADKTRVISIVPFSTGSERKPRINLPFLETSLMEESPELTLSSCRINRSINVLKHHIGGDKEISVSDLLSILKTSFSQIPIKRISVFVIEPENEEVIERETWPRMDLRRERYSLLQIRVLTAEQDVYPLNLWNYVRSN